MTRTKKKTKSKSSSAKSKPAPRKRATPKAPTRKAAAPKPKPAPPVKSLARKEAKPEARPPPSRAPRQQADVSTLPTRAQPRPRSELGLKYLCFACGAKFYDLNRPEPLCPKCGADQRNRPERDLKPKPLPVSVRRPPDRSMAPLLDDDDDEAVLVNDEDLDLGIGVVDSPDDVTEEDEPDDEDLDES